MNNGGFLFDTDGDVLHAHGGHIIRHGEYFYWYGEDRRRDFYVSCYRSADLKSWEFRRHVLTVNSSPDLSRGGRRVNIERPKVVYCEATGKFVMWAHYENGADYTEAAACVAVCDVPDGDFEYHGHFRPLGHMSRDCTLFTDPVTRAVYFISASRDNADLHVYRLSEDCTRAEKLVNVLFPGQFREAPAVFYRDGKYHMLTSACTGWAPNQGCHSSADSMEGAWSPLLPFGDGTTFHSQPAFVLPHSGEYYYFADRWGGFPMSHPFDYSKSSYVILKINFTETGSPFIEWNDLFPVFG